MLNRLSMLVTLLSLVLFAASCVMWVRSHRVRDVLATDHVGGNHRWITSMSGALHFQTDLDGGFADELSWRSRRISPPPGWTNRNSYPPEVRWFLGFAYGRYTTAMRIVESEPSARFFHLQVVVVPYWFVTLLFAACSAVSAMLQWRSSHRRQAGHCVHCGYDLRASLGRCPECGNLKTAGAP
jgi:hypothetical protein